MKKINELELTAFNSYGGFSKNGREYVVLNASTPLPWCNVLANENFGTVISTYGTVYTYFENSREYKITDWCNDWTKMKPGEIFKGIFEDVKNYNLTYGLGYVKTTEEDEKNLLKNMEIFVPVNDNIKIQYITIENGSEEEQEFNISYTIIPVLGVSSEIDGKNITKKEYEDIYTIVFRNPYNGTFKDSVCYIMATDYANEKANKITEDEKTSDVKLEKTTEIAIDSENFSITIKGKIEKGDKKEFAIMLGGITANEKGSEEDTKSIEESIRKIKEKYSIKKNMLKEEKAVREYWEQKVVRNFSTGDEYLDIMANGWLLYQTISCRLFARTAFYQSGGAIGYRDQLQDTLALISSWPEKTRSQLILNSTKQFERGDVLHWWHKETGAGIKTYFSDDYLWLPYVLSEYVAKTGDKSVLEVETNYLKDKEMGNVRELYEVFETSNTKASVYEHAKRAITYSLSRISDKNGLLDIGDGDWNDGFSNIRGQSVWLTFFMIDILHRFVKIAEIMKDKEMITKCKSYASTLKQSIIENAWDTDHFVRAFFENGEVLGANSNDECKIDLISQAWAAISLKNDRDMQDEIRESLEAADKFLVDRENKIVKLLYPPFDKPKNNPGYIKAYVPGTRENGGQYTHAAVWLAKAYFEIGEKEKGKEILKLICPIYHSDSKEIANIYMVEPFVVAADVYSNKEHVGRGGWTWYTGSAGWMYKVIEDNFKEGKNFKENK